MLQSVMENLIGFPGLMRRMESALFSFSFNSYSLFNEAIKQIPPSGCAFSPVLLIKV